MTTILVSQEFSSFETEGYVPRMPLSLFGIIVQASLCSRLCSTKNLVNGGKVCSADCAVQRNYSLQIPVEFSGSYLPPLRVALETGQGGPSSFRDGDPWLEPLALV